MTFMLQVFNTNLFGVYKPLRSQVASRNNAI